MLEFENSFYSNDINLIAGTDEAGRGPLAGPLVVAAVVLDKGFNDELINDSKKLTKNQREKAYDLIIKNALDYSIVIIDVDEIDKLNIYSATKLGMSKCLLKLKEKPDLYLTDAMPLDIDNYKIMSLIKGDTKSKNIAAASILAKVTRDRIMDSLDIKFPQYGFKSNKGYGTKKHISAINEFGIIDGIHRLSFEPCKSIYRKIKLFW